MFRPLMVGRAGWVGFAIVFGLNLVGAITAARAGFLNPLDYSSQGAFVGTATSYTVDESTQGTTQTVTLTSGGNTLYTAVISNGIAVFDYDSISLPSGSTITGIVEPGSSSIPVAFLSRGDVNMAGAINFSGSTSSGFPNDSAPGGGLGGFFLQAPIGPGAGGNNPGGTGGSGAGGGAFGGNGGQGGLGANSVVGTGGGGGGLPGGTSYGNLATLLQGGSGGGQGQGTFTGPSSGGNGGSGGGGIEIGALGQITISGAIIAVGGNGAQGQFGAGGGGGGSGGGIFLHATNVTLSGSLDTMGGTGGPGSTGMPGTINGGGGGGGGGGQILIDTSPGGFTSLGGSFNMNGGGGGSTSTTGPATGLAGANGTVAFLQTAPEPSAWISLAIGFCGLVGVRCLRRSS